MYLGTQVWRRVRSREKRSTAARYSSDKVLGHMYTRAQWIQAPFTVQAGGVGATACDKRRWPTFTRLSHHLIIRQMGPATVFRTCAFLLSPTVFNVYTCGDDPLEVFLRRIALRALRPGRLLALYAGSKPPRQTGPFYSATSPQTVIRFVICMSDKSSSLRPTMSKRELTN